MRLRALPCLLLLLLVLPTVVVALDKNCIESPSPEGTWLTVVYYQGVPLIQYLQNFTRDGRTTALLPFGAGINSDDTRVGGMGEWRLTGHRTLDVTMYALNAQDPTLKPDVLRFKLKLDKGGNHLSGPFTYYYATPGFLQEGLTQESTRLGLLPLD